MLDQKTLAAARAAADKKKPASGDARDGMTVAAWCEEVGSDRHILKKRLQSLKASPIGSAKGKGSAGSELYRVRDLYSAMGGGEWEAERLRKTREEADKLAIQNARSRGELVEIAAVKKLGERVMVAIRNRILAFPLTDDEKDALLRELLELGKMDWSREA